jgi:hypothetical protein
MYKGMNKKGVDTLTERIVFLVLIALFFGLMFAGVTLVGRQITLYEQVYAKQIALIVDKAEPGMDIEFTNFKIFKLAADNNAPNDIVSFNNELNIVTVRLSSGKGYNYKFFNDVDVVWNIIPDRQLITIKIVESKEVKDENVE